MIQQLTTEFGLNLAGVQRVLAMEDEMDKLRRRVARLERQMRAGEIVVPTGSRLSPSPACATG